jgi:hypothetical protein
MFDRTKPMIAFHTTIIEHESIPALLRLIEEGLSPLGFNTLVLEMRYAFRCFPEYATGTITYEDAGLVADACQARGIRLVPLLPCLSHQSVHHAQRGLPYPLFVAHAEFLERQGVDPSTDWPHFALHSWCASDDRVYDYIFPMMDEMAEACRAEAVHCGLDELFDIAVCPRCEGQAPDALFARTVKKLHDHLAEKGLSMMMWGDRLLDAQKMGYSMWEGDRFGVHPALDRKDEVTRDIIICDWHYDWHSAGYPSVETLVREGFFVAPAFFNNTKNAKHFWLHALEAYYLGERYGWPGKLGGLMCTNWRGLDAAQVENMLKGIAGEKVADESAPGYGVGQVMAAAVGMVARIK